MKPAAPLAEVLEDEWDRQLFRGPRSLAVTLGWASYHVLRSKGSRAGYPDRTCVRERILFAELKREKTKPTAEQVEWLDRLAAAGGEVYLWRPSDLDEIGVVLGTRWIYDATGGGLIRSGPVHPDLRPFQPRSLWLPGCGRRDSQAPVEIGG